MSELQRLPGAAAREPLPLRRGSENIGFRHGDIDYTVSVGFYPDGRIGELFLQCAKYGTQVDTNARDSAILFSLARQFGCPLETISRALTRNSDGGASGALAHALDLLMRAPG